MRGLSSTRLSSLYWAVQVGLLTPLTFAQHCLHPLAVFTSGAYFLKNGRRWQWICEVDSASFKGAFEGPQSDCVWAKQEFVAHATGCQFFFLFSMHLWSDQPKNNTFFFSILHHLSTIFPANTTVLAFVLLCNSRLNKTSIFIHSMKQCLLRNQPGSGSCDISGLLSKWLWRVFTHANQFHWTAQ